MLITLNSPAKKLRIIKHSREMSTIIRRGKVRLTNCLYFQNTQQIWKNSAWDVEKISLNSSEKNTLTEKIFKLMAYFYIKIKV